jgi:mRNA-degrading endonuclease RelE of RelBE toxin-antitoxin system
MRYSIILSPDAVNCFKRMRANMRSLVREGIIEYLGNEPEKISKSRIKRLRGVERPQYRLRIGDIRVYYDVDEQSVEILAIVTKKRAKEWLERHGN